MSQDRQNNHALLVPPLNVLPYKKTIYWSVRQAGNESCSPPEQLLGLASCAGQARAIDLMKDWGISKTHLNMQAKIKNGVENVYL